MNRYKKEMIKSGKLKVNIYKKDKTVRNSFIATAIILLVGIVVLWLIV